MSERFVEIAVKKEIREIIRQAKGKQSYNEFFTKLLLEKKP